MTPAANGDEYFFLSTSRTVLPTFQTFCPDGVRFAQTVVHFAHFQVRVGLGVFCVRIFPQKGFVTAE